MEAPARLDRRADDDELGPSLARDARKIVDAGYTIDRADAFDMFPNTPHVETVLVFNRI